MFRSSEICSCRFWSNPRSCSQTGQESLQTVRISEASVWICFAFMASVWRECVMSSVEMSSMYPEHLAGNCREGESDEGRWHIFLFLSYSYSYTWCRWRWYVRCHAEARPVFVSDITVCCGRKALQQPADCAHRLPLCDFTGRAQSELGDLHKH